MGAFTAPFRQSTADDEKQSWKQLFWEIPPLTSGAIGNVACCSCPLGLEGFGFCLPRLGLGCRAEVVAFSRIQNSSCRAVRHVELPARGI